MADVKISALPVATTINDVDLLVIVQGGTTKSILNSVIKADTLAAVNIAASFAETIHTPVTFQNGFTSTPISGQRMLRVAAAGYNQKFVQFKGVLNCTSATFAVSNPTEIFTLPVAYRPKVTLQFPVYSLTTVTAGGDPTATGVVTIVEGGQVYLNVLTGNFQTADVVDFSNINYYIAEG